MITATEENVTINSREYFRPEPIYIGVGYVSESRFSARTI